MSIDIAISFDEFNIILDYLIIMILFVIPQLVLNILIMIKLELLKVIMITGAPVKRKR